MNTLTLGRNSTYHSESANKMGAAIKSVFDPKIQLGTIFVFALNIIIGASWLISDHNSEVIREANQKEITTSLNTLLVGFALANKTIEINGGRISTLENNSREFNNRIEKLEMDYAIVVQDLADIKQTYHDLVTVTPNNLPIRQPRNR